MFQGEEVELRPCPFETRKVIISLLSASEDVAVDERAERYHRAVAMCLSSTVIGQDLTAEEWLDVLGAEDVIDDMPELVAAAMRCSGLSAAVSREIDQTDETLGNSPTG